MEKSRVSYKINHNDDDFFFPITVKTLYDNHIVFTDFATDMKGAFDIISERELSLEKKIKALENKIKENECENECERDL